MSDIQRFFILENYGKIKKNVKKRKNVFYIYTWSTSYARHVERLLITDKQTIPMDW